MTRILLMVFFFSVGPIWADASLQFVAASSSVVNHGNTGTDPTTATFIAWVYPTQFLAGTRLFSKATSGGAGQWVMFQAGAGTNNWRLFVDYGTTDANATTASNIYALNEWHCVSGVFDGTNAPKVYIASSTTRYNVVETAYSGAPTAPAGGRITDGGTGPVIGNVISSNTANGFRGNVAMVNWMPGIALSANQIQDLCLNPHPIAQSKIFSFYGFSGTGTQPDLSGSGFNGNAFNVTASAIGPPISIGGCSL